tara:strand:- start:24236 stop:25336 length:1101 start_codon:yes stop_codon:yes gene_type:complete
MDNTKVSYSKFSYAVLFCTAICLIVFSYFGVKAYHVLHKPLFLSLVSSQNQLSSVNNKSEKKLNLTVSKGENFKDIKQKLNLKNTFLDNIFLSLYIKVSKKDKNMQAGYYEFDHDVSLNEVIDKISNGDVKVSRFQLVEGITVAQILNNLKKSEDLVLTLPYDEKIDANKLAKLLKLPYSSSEGLFFPDTYYYNHGETDKDILLKAYNNMQQKLNVAWNNKDLKVYNKYSKKYLHKPYDVLRLAAIVEKEAAEKSDREKVAGVFLLRLNKNMRLQADPTVIYSLQDKFTGDLKKHHLKYDSPYNTYVKKGLPPAPISSVSIESINAVLKPNITGYLYFVASGNGKTHLFSKSIENHNSLVKRVLLK